VSKPADTVKRVTLELGGKSPNIFFADADFEDRNRWRSIGVFINQAKSAPPASRILVQKSDLQRNLSKPWPSKAKKIKLGPPLERETKMGPLITKINTTALTLTWR